MILTNKYPWNEPVKYEKKCKKKEDRNINQITLIEFEILNINNLI